ncbi:MAG: polysaccharide deacetylase family protein [Candidatus Eremiobacteraeota bacterium]|nr:polysaccharide deacetylase family protein [Candidatus Eremiobacteraeota bacterium]
MNARAFAGCLALTLGIAAPAPAQDYPGVPVLMYHKVNAVVPRDAVGRDLTVTPDRFEAQLRYLREHGIRTITAAQLAQSLARGERPAHAVVLTFDDGYDDAATTALPLLKKYGAVGTFYVSAGFVGTPRHLDWKQIRALAAAGSEVACHGTFHRDLTTLDAAGQRFEAGHCVQTFGRYLARFKAVTYAYPAGQYDATTVATLRRLGIIAAFTEHPGVVRSLTAAYELPRRRIRHDDDVAAFAALATP